MSNETLTLDDVKERLAAYMEEHGYTGWCLYRYYAGYQYEAPLTELEGISVDDWDYLLARTGYYRVVDANAVSYGIDVLTPDEMAQRELEANDG